ncbi:MAG: hypothetical protein J5614_04345, partial [Paludibacteraceae bacterium]|nr:hypothetical protein [Paludibacteraceae bacterium]
MFENAYIRDDVRAFRLREENKFKLYHQKYGLRPIGLCQFDLSAKSLRFILTIMNIIKGDYNEVHYYGELKKCEQCVVVSIPYYFVCYYIFRTVLEDDKLKDLLKETLDEIYPRIQGRLNSSFDFENIKRSKKQQEIDNVQTNESSVTMSIPPYSKWSLPVEETNIVESKMPTTFHWDAGN